MANEREHASNAIKDFVQTISPFVSIAMAIIAYIYTNQMGENQKGFDKMADKIDKIEQLVSELKNGQTEMKGEITPMSAQVVENKNDIKDLKNRQNDLEKTVILGNATRK